MSDGRDFIDDMLDLIDDVADAISEAWERRKQRRADAADQETEGNS